MLIKLRETIEANKVIATYEQIFVNVFRIL